MQMRLMKRKENLRTPSLNKVAILYICTGKYCVFWEKFYKSFEKRFLFNTEKHYFVFTDSACLHAESKSNVHKIFQKQLGWPYDTLMRFHMFMKIEEELKGFDYIFFFNSNYVCKKRINEREFLPDKEQLLFVQHPGMYNKSREEFTYDENPQSLAYISKDKGKVYVAGGLNGGGSQVYLELIHNLKDNINTDLEHNVIARYHDESHINKYLLEVEDYRLLTPSYCYPEGWKLPFPKKMVVLAKSKYFNVEEVRRNMEDTKK